MALTQQTHGLPVSQGALSSSSRINETVELKSTRLVLGRNPRDGRFTSIFTVLLERHIFVSVMSQRHEPEANVAGVMSPIFSLPRLHLKVFNEERRTFYWCLQVSPPGGHYVERSFKPF